MCGGFCNLFLGSRLNKLKEIMKLFRIKYLMFQTVSCVLAILVFETGQNVFNESETALQVKQSILVTF